MSGRGRKILKWIGIALAALLVAALGFGYWLLATAPGARFAIERAKSALGGKVALARFNGTLGGPLELHDLQYQDAAAGVRVKIRELKLDYGFWGLLRKTLHVRNLNIDGVTVALTTMPPAAAHAAPPTLAQLLVPPLDILLDRAHVGSLSISHDGKPVFAIDSLDVAATWTASALTIGQFKLRAPDGKVDLDGAMTSYPNAAGSGKLDFDWKIPAGQDAPPLRAAGTVDVNNDGKQAHFTLALGEPIQAHATATLAANDAALPWTLAVDVPDFDPGKLVQAEALQGLGLKLSGSVNADGNSEKFHAEGNLSIGPPGQPADLAFRLDGTPQKITLGQLALKQPNGGLDAAGEIMLKPRIGWNLEASAVRFDPGAFVRDWPGAVDFHLSTKGDVDNNGPEGTLTLDRLGGRLRQRSLSGSGEVAFAPPLRLSGKLNLASGQSRIAIIGKGGTARDAPTDLALDLDIASLGDWLPKARGSVRGAIAVNGNYPRLNASGKLRGSGIAGGDTHLQEFALGFDVRDLDAPSGKFTLDAKTLGIGGYTFDTVKLDAHGSRSAHQLTLVLDGKPLALDLALDGALTPGKPGNDWHGTLQTLTLRPQGLPQWSLPQPAALSYVDGGFAMKQVCLQTGVASVCAQASQDRKAGTHAKFRLEHLPLAMLASLAIPDSTIRIDGDLAGQGDMTLAPDGVLGGSVSIASGSGAFAFAESVARPALSYRNFRADAVLSQKQSTITVASDLNDGGRIDGHIAIGAGQGAALPLSGSLSVDINNLSFVDLLSPQVSGTRGKVEAKFALSGTTAKPGIDGSARLVDFATEIPAAGLKLREGNFDVASNDGEHLRIDGSIASAEGKLTIAGDAGIASDAPTHIAIAGKGFLAADIPGAKVYISPDLTIDRDAQRLKVGGTVRIPRMSVDLAKLPGGSTAAAVSPDVVVTDETAMAPASALPVEVDVSLTLGAGEALAMDLRQGSEVHLVGYGLDANLGGQLRVTQAPGKPPLGRGQIDVNGTFKAYGQDLQIEPGQGRLLFAGTPMENPGLDIRATRSFPDQNIVVGLQVRGTGLAPQLTVFSRPGMEQSDALSYLVAGKPLSQLKGGDGSAVSSAASALGTAGGDLLAKSIGARLGLDDVGVADNSSIGGAALTVGKYLSPRLYIGYGVGLFAPGQVVTLRYKLTRLFNFEMRNGTLSSRAGIDYRIEK